MISWAAAYSSIHVISGAILDSDHNGFRDNDKDYNRYVCTIYYEILLLLFAIHRWTDGTGSIAIPTQFYSIAIQCRNKSVDISDCSVEDIQALGIVMYHEESNEVCI